MNCLIYVTYYITDINAEYIRYVKDNLPEDMEMVILYDIRSEDNSFILREDYNFHYYNSLEIPNFMMNGIPKLVQPILPLIDFVKKSDYEHYLLMENDIVLDGDMSEFLYKINNSNTDYIHIAHDNYEWHWPIEMIKNYNNKIYFSWCQLVYMSKNFINYVIENYNETMYYEFLLPSLAYNNTDKFSIKQFESFGYNFIISAEPDEVETMKNRYISNVVPNVFFHQIKDLSNFKRHHKSSDIKCAVTCPCKMENRYIREWVEHYKKLGFVNAIIVDNNDPDGERCADVLQDYIEEGFVIIKDYIGQEWFQKAIHEVYHEFGWQYDWLASFETDEYLYLEEKFDNNINNFLSQTKFDNFDIIELCWKNYGDSGLITVENNDYSIQNRFTEVVKSGTIEDEQPKCIIRTTKDIIHLEGPHLDIINSHEIMRRCNTEGIALTHLYNYGATIKPRSYKDAYIKHYRTKTLQEYIEHRIRRGVPFDHQVSKTHNINFFFLFNERTPQKEEWLKENYPDYYNQLFEPYFLGDFYTHDWTLDIYNY